MTKKTSVFSVILTVIFLGAMIAAVVLSFLPTKPKDVTPETENFTISNYNVDMTYCQDNTILVTESISVDFLANRHGIYRVVPEVSQMKLFNEDNTVKVNQAFRLTYQLQSAQFGGGGACPVATESNSDLFYIRLGSDYHYYHPGDAETFIINYKILVDERYSLYDVFYFNVLGNMMQTTIANFAATVHFQQPIPTPNTHIYYGSVTSTEELSTFSWSADKKTLSITASNLGVGEGVTAKLDLPQNYITITPSHTTDIVMLVLILLSAGIVALVFFKCHNRKIVTPVVQFKASPKFTPADVGYIIDKKVNSEDIAALVIYWAQKGFLKIVEEGKKTFLVQTEKQFEGKMYERQIFEAIFNNVPVGEKINLKKIGAKIVDAVTMAKKEIPLQNEKMFSSKAVFLRGFVCLVVAVVMALTLVMSAYQKVANIIMLASVVAGVGAVIALFAICGASDKKHTRSKASGSFGKILIVLFCAGLLVLAIFARDAYTDPYYATIFAVALFAGTAIAMFALNARTDEGVEKLGDIIGLKNFIEVAEKSRLKMLVKDNPQAFYEILPYAYVLGVYDTWCKKFESIDIGLPEFYEGNTNLMNVLIISQVLRSATASILSTMNSANMASMADNLSKNVGSFSGGGSGGGFSGGGVGGGGAGSW